MSTDQVQSVSRQGDVVIAQLVRQGAAITLTLTPEAARALAQQLEKAAGSEDAKLRQLVRE